MYLFYAVGSNEDRVRKIIDIGSNLCHQKPVVIFSDYLPDGYSEIQAPSQFVRKPVKLEDKIYLFSTSDMVGASIAKALDAFMRYQPTMLGMVNFEHGKWKEIHLPNASAHKSYLSVFFPSEHDAFQGDYSQQFHTIISLSNPADSIVDDIKMSEAKLFGEKKVQEAGNVKSAVSFPK